MKYIKGQEPFTHSNYKMEVELIKKELNFLTEEMNKAPQTFRNSFKNKFKRFYKSIKYFEEKTDYFSTIIVELGWPPSDYLLQEHMDKIVEMYKKYSLEKTRKEVNTLFLKSFNKKVLYSILDNWKRKKWFKKRIPILNEAIDSHIKNHYYASVSLILLQIEGIIAYGYGQHGYMSQTKLKKYINKLLKNDEKCSFDSAIKSFYLEIILNNFEHGKPPESFLSRHAILHGGDTEFGTAENSLKSILIFDYIQDKFRLISNNNDEYHLPNCSILNENKNSEWVLYNNYIEAETEGKNPCRICNPYANFT